MKPTVRVLAAAIFVLVSCAGANKGRIGDDAPAKDPGVSDAGTQTPTDSQSDAGEPAGDAGTAAVTPPPEAQPAAEAAAAAPAAAEPALDPTAGAAGTTAPAEEAAADPSSEETTSEGLKSDSLESRASGRPDHPRTLKEIVKAGYIRVLTRNNDTSFFIYRGHRMGFDYELGKRLAQRLGIRVDMVITNDWNEMVPALLRGEGDVIASEVTVTDERKQQVLFADSWGQAHEVVVSRDGVPAVQDAQELSGKKVSVRKGSTYEESLVKLNEKLKAAGKPEVQIDGLSGDTETDTILEKLSKGELDYTVADDLLANIHTAFWDNIVIGPAVSDDRDLAWAVRPGDTALQAQINQMLREVRKKPDFNLLKRKYFEASRNFKKERKDKFYAAETGTLSPFDPLIQKHAEVHGFDWRLVAAQIYQESHFDVTRKSWVGAMGLFQIMPKTARGLGITNPTDPEQSIRGGLKYMKQLMAHYEDIGDAVERYRFAMAAYNSGFGHVDDARKLARAAGEDAAQWKVTSKWLLRLAKKEYFRKTRFGFCRGFEPVDYVRHIDERYAGYAQLVPLKKAEAASRD